MICPLMRWIINHKRRQGLTINKHLSLEISNKTITNMDNKLLNSFLLKNGKQHWMKKKELINTI